MFYFTDRIHSVKWAPPNRAKVTLLRRSARVERCVFVIYWRDYIQTPLGDGGLQWSSATAETWHTFISHSCQPPWTLFLFIRLHKSTRVSRIWYRTTNYCKQFVIMQWHYDSIAIALNCIFLSFLVGLSEKTEDLCRYQWQGGIQLSCKSA